MANFIELNSSEQLEKLFEKSNEQPVVLFKHSVTCPISASVYGEIADVESDVNLVIVQRSRDISNEIAQKTGIRHESPQAIVLKDGKAIYNASHYDITSDELSEKLIMENGKQI